MPRIADHRQWWAALLLGLMLLLLLLIASWLLRAFVPVAPALTLSAVQMPALPSPPDPPDPTPGLRASLDDAQTDKKKLNSALAALQADLRRKMEQCKPAERPSPNERWTNRELGPRQR